MSAALVKYDEMCRAITAAHSVDEVKTLRDKAAALEAYSRLARDVQNEKLCAEIRLRSERRLGELLRETEKGRAGRPQKNQLRSQTNFQKSQGEAGISKDQAHRYQRLAAVPADEFESHLGGAKKPTTSGILREHREKTGGGQQARPGPTPEGEAALRLWGESEDYAKALAEVKTAFAISGMTDRMVNETVAALKTINRLAPKALEALNHERDKRRNLANA